MHILGTTSDSTRTVLLQPWQLFWAKTDRGNHLGLGENWTHPLWAHLIDVAHVAEALADRLPTPVKTELADGLGLKWDEARSLLALLIGLHDAGKAIPSFQTAHPLSRDALRAEGIDLQDRYPNASDRRHHGHASISILHAWIDGLPVADDAKPMLRTLAAFVGFHHGRLENCNEWNSDQALGRGRWLDTQQALVGHVADVWMEAHGGWPDLSGAPEARFDPFPAAALAFAGWTTLADWVGSMSEHMPPDAASYEGLKDYLPASRAAAEKAIAAASLDKAPDLRAEGSVADFARLFPETFDGTDATPHRLQKLAATASLPDDPALVLIEAPTGEGKTEAAFHLAARLQARRPDGRGVYVALPTQATSNGLFPRFHRFLAHAHEGGDPLVMLAHGASALNLDLEALLEPQDEDETAGARAYAARWFLPTKRSLLAPYGVGTVDQALMGAVTSRHFFLRLYALAGKTVVFDEVHAYDGYMAALFGRLLSWLRALGSDVVVLTATLPTATRRTLLRSWNAPLIPDPDAYPVLAVAEGGASDLAAFLGGFETSQTAQAEIDFGESDPVAVSARVAEAAKEGATVGVIVNRVDRAQDVFQRLRRMEDEGALDADLHLLHARFPFEDRRRRERDAIERFGKEGRRQAERPAVLVATQVAEQSLDLDVDLMLSDLAPIDLLLQRAGRLHRHPALEDLRPEGYRTPRLVVLRPPLDAPNALPEVAGIGGQFAPDDPEGIYLDLPLFRTDLVLRERVARGEGWSLPDDYRPLIEAVYGPDADAPPDGLRDEDRERWQAAVDAKEKQEGAFEQEASLAAIQAPARLGEMVRSGHYRDRSRYDEHDDAPARDLQPTTRLGHPSVNAVCLHRRDDGLFLDAEHPFPSGPDLSRDETRDLLLRAVRLSRRSVVAALPAQDVPEEWKHATHDAYALAYHHPLVFKHGHCAVGGTVIALDDDLGIRYDPDSS